MKIRISSVKKMLEFLYLALLGFMAFSRMSQYIIFNVLHLPFYLIEIFFIPLFLYSGNEYITNLKKISSKRKFVIWCMVLTYDLIIGCAYTFQLIDTITMSRSLIYIIMIALIFEEKKHFSIDKLFVISFFAMVGEFVFGIKYSSADIASINTSCLALMVLIPIVMKKYLLFTICSIFGLVISINSGYRIGIIILIIAILEGVVWTAVSQEKMTIKVLLKKFSIPSILVLIASFVVINYQEFIRITATLLGTSQYAIYRVTNRLVGLFTFNFTMSREQERFDVFKIAYESFGERILPRGLVGKSIGTLSTYFDVPITYMYDAFGSILTIFILGVCIYKGMRCFLHSYKKGVADYYIIAGLMFPILLLCMISNGSFLYITFQCITTGVIIGEWFAFNPHKKTQ